MIVNIKIGGNWLILLSYEELVNGDVQEVQKIEILMVVNVNFTKKIKQMIKVVNY